MPKHNKKKRLPTKWLKILTVAVASATIVTGSFAYKTLPYFIGEQVIEVVDGDTFQIANKQNIRLYGINAPELENCLGPEAKQALTELILGKKVIVREPIVKGNRPIALVYRDNVLINAAMLYTGLVEYDRFGESETKKLKAASDFAKTNQLGIYSLTCLEPTPPNSKCVIKANINPENGTKLYYPPNCQFYKLVIIKKYEGDRWLCTSAEALSLGFRLADGCKIN